MNQKRPPYGHEETRLARRVKTASQISAAVTIPSMILVGLVGGYFLGVWLESRFGGKPWFSFGGLVLGGVASVRQVIRIMRVPRRGPDEDE